jgi:hypothetical protein
MTDIMKIPNTTTTKNNNNSILYYLCAESAATMPESKTNYRQALEEKHNNADK